MIKKCAAFLCILMLAGILTSCGSDPWNSTTYSKDIVTITKTTRYTGKKGDLANLQLKGAKVTKSPLIRATVGAVKMSHIVHSDNGLKCIDCHHVKNNENRIKQCAVCHRGNDGFDKLHGLCIDCHIGKKNGITRCMHCH